MISRHRPSRHIRKVIDKGADKLPTIHDSDDQLKVALGESDGGEEKKDQEKPVEKAKKMFSVGQDDTGTLFSQADHVFRGQNFEVLSLTGLEPALSRVAVGFILHSTTFLIEKFEKNEGKL